jgi:hypothetical protein
MGGHNSFHSFLVSTNNMSFENVNVDVNADGVVCMYWTEEALAEWCEAPEWTAEQLAEQKARLKAFRQLVCPNYERDEQPVDSAPADALFAAKPPQVAGGGGGEASAADTL